MTARRKDIAAGVVLLALAGAYHLATRQIPRSSLSDEVGADGLPRVLTVALVLLGAAIALRGLLRRAPLPAVARDDDDEAHRSTLPRALGFLAIGVGYMLVAPLVGYALAIALLIAAVAVYEGMAPSWRLAAVACGGGVLFWLIFAALLGVAQPVSRLWG